MDTSPEWKAAVARMMGQQSFGFNPQPMPTGIGAALDQTNQQLFHSANALMDRLLPSYSQPSSGVPWWMTGVSAREPQAAAAAPAPDMWGDIQAQTNREQNITDQLGDFSKRVLSSKYFMGGE